MKAGCLQASTLCVGTDDESEGDAVEGAAITAAAPALALVTIDSFRYGNNLSDGRIDKTEKVNRHLADHNFFSDAWCIERVLRNGESNFYARCLIGCNPIKLTTNDARCDPFRNFIRHRKLTMCILSALGLRSARTERSFLGRSEISLDILQRAA
jgi:hypothetical protein